MANYYIETVNGRRGPYTAEDITRGVRKGTVPLGAKLVDANGHSVTPAEVVRANQRQAAPIDGGSENVQPSSDPAPQLSSTQQSAYPQQPSYPQQSPYPQQPAYPQQSAYPQQPAYPQQSSYPQQAAYPYPGNAGQYAPQPPTYLPYGQQTPYPVSMTPATSGLAIASLTLSLTTLVFCLPLWIGGLICGFMALGECEPNGRKSGRGLALAGIWTGAIFGVLYVLGIVWFIAMMNSDAQTW